MKRKRYNFKLVFDNYFNEWHLNELKQRRTSPLVHTYKDWLHSSSNYLFRRDEHEVLFSRNILNKNIWWAWIWLGSASILHHNGGHLKKKIWIVNQKKNHSRSIHLLFIFGATHFTHRKRGMWDLNMRREAKASKYTGEVIKLGLLERS